MFGLFCSTFSVANEMTSFPVYLDTPTLPVVQSISSIVAKIIKKQTFHENLLVCLVPSIVKAPNIEYKIPKVLSKKRTTNKESCAVPVLRKFCLIVKS
jgi:hypothetical protein